MQQLSPNIKWSMEWPPYFHRDDPGHTNVHQPQLCL